MTGDLHEECGVFGIFSDHTEDVATKVYYGLFSLQHRGQESCGIAVNNDGVITSYKDAGLVNDVFDSESLAKLRPGKIAIGHVRYGTTGNDRRLNAQPIVVNHRKGRMALAHNGNLTNDAELREELEMNGSIFHTTSDSEVIAYIVTRERLKSSSVEEAVCRAMDTITGAYSLILMSPSKLIAARDPRGFRPLCLGKLENRYIVASETCALTALGAEFIRDIEPGEVLTIDDGGLRSDRTHCKKENPSLCVFELIYFARQDSVLDGVGVHSARMRAGSFLALEHPIQADVVIGVPDSGLDAAMGYAKQSGIPYGAGLIKNRYIGRTFIEPMQSERENLVKMKLSPVASVVRGKRVILVDDSIVRGTTSAAIVKILRAAGAAEVHFLSSAPKFLYPCYFGTDIDSQEKLFAWNNTDEEMIRKLGVDSIGFLSAENVMKLSDNPNVTGFCAACFTGKYPCKPPIKCGKDKYSRKLSEKSEEADEK